MIILLISACRATYCFAVAENTLTIWQNPTNLSKYQLAWNTLNKSREDIYYQVTATSLMSDIIYPTYYRPEFAQVKCWSVQYLNQNAERQTASRKYSYGLTAQSQQNEV
uniref:Putative secreted protein n=1 Tax=Amblyomma cajennense TaxID=34607 RepID=A0A023FDX2_AMBCJ